MTLFEQISLAIFAMKNLCYKWPSLSFLLLVIIIWIFSILDKSKFISFTDYFKNFESKLIATN